MGRRMSRIMSARLDPAAVKSLLARKDAAVGWLPSDQVLAVDILNDRHHITRIISTSGTA